ncbi:hypothetical protein OEZ86_010836 [Tetradesmus obliquus]|nr:hypothetical protein OEZ86_010836 [Tetradesmus obliquus]
MSQVWRISLSNLSRNLLEATELANVLQEVSSSIQVTGLSKSLSGRTSTSISGNPTKLSARERIRSAVPIQIGAGVVPWEQLVGVLSTDDALHDACDAAEAADRQPQMLEVNTGGAVFFLFFKLRQQPAAAVTSSSSGPSELLGELNHLPCFLLMEYVEGDRLSDSPQALQGCAVEPLLEDVGCLFLLDMLLGNADRMPCPDLGWRGNANNLLHGAPGTRHEGRPVAIDSCVARRPPALKASAEDAAVERLAQLLLSVPDVSRSLLQQLLANLKCSRGQCSRLTMDGAAEGGTDALGSQGGVQGAAAGGTLAFSDADITRFQAGLRKCLTGVLQIKGLLEMVSTKIAEWIAEFVADVVRLNPALLPSPAGNGPPTPGGLAAAAGGGGGLLRSPRPSPRPSLRNMYLQGGPGSGGGTPNAAHPQQQQGRSSTTSSSSSSSSSSRRSSTPGTDSPSPRDPVDSAAVPVGSDAAGDGPSTPAGSSRGGVPCGGNNSSSSNHGQGGGLKFFKHLGSPAGKALPLARRAVSHLGFASIKAAICSSTDAATSPAAAAAACTHSTACIPPLVPVTAGSSNSSSLTGADVATAVAAALSPRATQAQTQALAGVFGGGSFVGADGTAVGPGKPSCARRMPWGAHEDSNTTPSKLSTHDLFPSTPIDENTPAAAPDGRRAASCIVPATSTPAAAYSPQRSSNGSMGHAQQHQQQQQQQQQGPLLSRHASFPLHHATATAAAAAAIAAVRSPVRSSSSSLQVLASIQLDATLASIKQEARHDGALAERMAHWTAVFRERGAELAEAIASWQTRHHLAAVLSTGFLDGSHPIVDAYELGVRLQHMLRRLAALAAGAMVQAPTCVLPGLWLGNAVAADSHHLLQYLGVTHVVNAAQELQCESAPGLFQVHRVAIRDEEEEDVAAHFMQVQAWIDAALCGGGAVLVHCHEGKSRSVALLLGYLMLSRQHTLAAALAHIRSVRPEACPNAGFMLQLLALDRQLHGTASLSRADLPRAKPEARICSVCGAAAGVSYASLVRHMKTKHKAAVGAACSSSGGGRSAGGAAVVAAAAGNAAAAALPPLGK